MQEKFAQKRYVYLLQKWCQEPRQSQFQTYYQTFQRRVQQTFDNVAITFDDRVIGAFHHMLKKDNFLQFSSQPQHLSPQKAKLVKISHILYMHKFIGKKDLGVIQKYSNTYLLIAFQQFLEQYDSLMKKNTELSKQKIAKLWSKHIQTHFVDFWNYLNEKQIYHKDILKLITACQPVIDWSNSQFKNLIRLYQYKTNQFLGPKQGKIKSLEDQKQNKYNTMLDAFVTQNSFFLRQNLLRLALNQIHFLFEKIKTSSSAFSYATYQVYGSFRSGFSLLNESDADINLLISGMHTQLGRRDQISYLNQVISGLEETEKRRFDKSMTCKLYSFQKIPVPFVKVQYSNVQYKNILNSIDIVINSHHGVANSIILQNYSKSVPILKLCNLIKLWAKKKCLINIKRPMEGLSSYGVILMVLFYLIQTKQAPYIKTTTVNKYELQSPLPKEEQFKSLLQNFKGWLQFYNIDGLFFQRNMTVCLLQKYTVDQSLKNIYHINMYDPIDNTNPGRMQKRLAYNFFNLIEQALQILNNEEGLDRLFISNN